MEVEYGLWKDHIPLQRGAFPMSMIHPSAAQPSSTSDCRGATCGSHAPAGSLPSLALYKISFPRFHSESILSICTDWFIWWMFFWFLSTCGAHEEVDAQKGDPQHQLSIW